MKRKGFGKTKRLNEKLMSSSVEIMLGDEVKWLFRLLKIPVKRPKNIGELKLHGAFAF